QQRRPVVPLDVGNLFREMSDRELRRLSRADVIEWPNANDVQAGRACVLVADQVGGGFAGAIRTRRPEGTVLVERLIRRFRLPVYLSAANVKNSRFASPAVNSIV